MAKKEEEKEEKEGGGRGGGEEGVLTLHLPAPLLPLLVVPTSTWYHGNNVTR